MKLKDMIKAIGDWFSGHFGETLHTVVAAAKKFEVDELQKIADALVAQHDGSAVDGITVFKTVFDLFKADAKVIAAGVPGWLLGLLIHNALGNLRISQAPPTP